MPRPKLKSRSRAGYNDEHKEALTYGYDWFRVFAAVYGEHNLDYYDSPVIDERRKEAWEDLRDELMADWISKHPGTRPLAWWTFEAPERRRCINRELHPHDEPTRLEWEAKQEPTHAEHSRRLTRGRPSIIAGPDFKLDPYPRYETELEYLRRLNLLVPAELAQEPIQETELTRGLGRDF